MGERQVVVEKAYQEEVGRGTARLGDNAFRDLRIAPGDCIEIEGNDTTAATAWRADRKDWGNDMMRIDEFTRRNANIDLGETVKVRKVEATEADSVTLSPLEETAVQLGPDAVELIKPQILKRPLLESDIVPVRGSSNHPSKLSPGQTLPLVAIETKRKEIVRITPETTVTIQE